MGKDFDQLVEIMKKLRSDEGCPWDREQTLESLKPFLIEECYEVVEALESGYSETLKEELGDLLFQIIFIAQVGNEQGTFNIEEILQKINQKMIRRHPHVFSDKKEIDKKAVLVQWEQIKQQEKKGKTITKNSILDGIPKALPLLILAHRIQERVSRVGFDWEKKEDVMEKVEEELAELKEVLDKNNKIAIEEEIGDLLFSIVNLARFIKVDTEIAFNKAIRRFIDRFQYIENKVIQKGIELINLNNHEMDQLWEEAKDALIDN